MEFKTNILVVDDLEQNRYVLSLLLESNFKNLNIIEAENGQEALKIALEESIDLIILDVQMPDISGFEVARMLKMKQTTKDIPIIFLSAAFKSEELRSLGFEFGAVDYLTKPIDDIQLLNKIALYLKLFEKMFIEKQLRKKQEVQEALMMQQSKMAAIGEMLQSISHQWNQPLSAINLILYSIENMLESNTLSKSAMTKNISNIKEQIEFMSRCMSDFRFFFRPSKDEESFDIGRALRSVETIIQNRLLNQSVDFEVLASDGCEAMGYLNEFKHAVLNLCNNAIDAIDEYRKRKNISAHDYRGRIEIRCMCTIENEVKITIKDNGGGCEDAMVEKMFEKFYTTKGEEGAGIGLFMVKTIIEERMGGKIAAKNINNGMEFEITLKKGAIWMQNS